MNGHLLQVKNLHTYFFIPTTEFQSRDGIDFTLDRGETLGLVGDRFVKRPAWRKGASARSILQLNSAASGKIVQREILLTARTF